MPGFEPERLFSQDVNLFLAFLAELQASQISVLACCGFPSQEKCMLALHMSVSPLRAKITLQVVEKPACKAAQTLCHSKKL